MQTMKFKCLRGKNITETTIGKPGRKVSAISLHELKGCTANFHLLLLSKEEPKFPAELEVAAFSPRDCSLYYMHFLVFETSKGLPYENMTITYIEPGSKPVRLKR